MAMEYAHLSADKRKLDAEAAPRLDALVAALGGTAGRPWEPNPQERRQLIEVLLEDLNPSGQATWRSWKDDTTFGAISSLKLLGRNPVGTTSLTTHSALSTLIFHAGLAANPGATSQEASERRGQIAEEAIRVLANALLLHPMTRTDDVWNDISLADALSSRAFASTHLPNWPSPFLASRLLYLISASPSAAVVTLVDGAPLVPQFRDSLEAVAAHQASRALGDKGKQREAADEQTWSEWLKVLFNLMVQYPRSASLFPSASPSPSPNASPFMGTDDDEDGRSSVGEAEPVARSASQGAESLWSKRPRPFSRGSSVSVGSFRSSHSPRESFSTSPPMQPGLLAEAGPADRSRLAAPTPMGRESSDMSRRTLKASDATSDEGDGQRRSRIQKLVEGVGEMGNRVLGRSSYDGDGASRNRGGKKRKAATTASVGGTRASESSSDVGSVAGAESKFESLLAPVVDLYLLQPFTEVPLLQAPLMPMIQSMLNFAPSNPAFARPFPKGAIKSPRFETWTDPRTPVPPALVKTLALVDAILEAYSNDEGRLRNAPAGGSASVAESLTQVLALLSNLVSSSADLQPATRQTVRNKLVPPALAREQGLDQDRSGLMVGRLLRTMNEGGGPTSETLRGAAGAFLMRLYDDDAGKLVSAIGYGPLAGYLTSIGLAGAQPDPATLRDDLNPVTGAKWRDGKDGKAGEKSLEEMTDEEKEQEMLKLNDLFDRLNKTGVMKVEDPRRKMAEEGRFQELDQDAERQAAEKEEKEVKEAEEEMKRYKERKERLRTAETS